MFPACYYVSYDIMKSQPKGLIYLFIKGEIKMKARQVVAIVLWVLTGLSMLGAMMSGSMARANIFNWIGFFIPAIIGFILWYTATKK